jgi:hypothetical protein
MKSPKRKSIKVEYYKVCRTNQYESGNFGKKLKDAFNYGITHSFRSAAAQGLAECIFYNKPESETLEVRETRRIMPGETVEDYKAQFAGELYKMEVCRVTAAMATSFSQLWEQDDADILAYANQHGLLIEVVDPILSKSSEHSNPLSEPLRAWRLESYILYMARHAIDSMRTIRTVGLGDKKIDRQFESDMKEFWSTSGPSQNKIRLPSPVRRLLCGPKFTGELLSWDRTVEYVVNYYLNRLCTVSIPFEATRGIEIKPITLLGAIWLHTINTHWKPVLKEKFCSSCGVSLWGSRGNTKYCEEHRTPRARQERQRSKKKNAN